MAKKRIPQPKRHLRAVPPPAPTPPTFAELVEQLVQAYKAQDGRTCDRLLHQLPAFPEAQQVGTADRQTLYFAISAWYWKVKADTYAAALDAEQAEVDAAEQAEVDADEQAEAAVEQAEADAIAASRRAMRTLVQRLCARLGAAGEPDPSLPDVCAWFVAEIEEAMEEELFTVRTAREAARAEREAADNAQEA